MATWRVCPKTLLHPMICLADLPVIFKQTLGVKGPKFKVGKLYNII